MLALISLFPDNGLDRSLHAAVYIGVIFSTLFSEWFGWTFAGLVVPGYLATVFATAPVTGICIVLEALLTYAIVAILGRYLTRTRAWSSAFGRERFYLFLLIAVAVRLGTEGLLIPELQERYSFAHARELYSVGLVLVPLLANSFWNGGFVYTLPRLHVLVGLTFLVLSLLLHTTNLSVGRFQLLNESLSLHFMDSSKAQIILLVGAFIGARNNIRYGWDYSGILVPGLLAVAWYEPLKLLTTGIEALVVYGVSVLIASTPPLSRILIVGPRRVLLAYSVGFFLKFGASSFLSRFAEGVPLIDYFGFGYLLPTLLAVKMWNRDETGRVLMPTLQVSIAAFLIGNVIGYLIPSLARAIPEGRDADAPISVGRANSVGLELMLADTTPRAARREGAESAARVAPARDVGLAIAQEIAAGHALSQSSFRKAKSNGLALTETASEEGSWLCVGYSPAKAEEAGCFPRFSIRKASQALSRVLLVPSEGASSPAPLVAEVLAGELGAAAIVLHAKEDTCGSLDKHLASEIAHSIPNGSEFRIEITGGAASLSVVGEVPKGLDQRALENRLGEPVRVEFRAFDRKQPFSNLPTLYVPIGALGRLLPQTNPTVWAGSLRTALTEHADEITHVASSEFRAPSITELRAFGELVRDASAGVDHIEPWHGHLADRLGFSLVAVGDPKRPKALGYVELRQPRRGHASLFWRPTQKDSPTTNHLLIEVPVPGWEAGVLGLGGALFQATNAQAVLMGGALPSASPLSDPRRSAAKSSYFHRAHEEWLGFGNVAISVQGIEEETSDTPDALVTFGRESDDVPSWFSPLQAALGAARIAPAIYSGGANESEFRGSSDVGMAYARRFARDQFAIAYFGSFFREFFTTSRQKPSFRTRTLERALRAAVNQRADNPSRIAFELLQCDDQAGPCTDAKFAAPTAKTKPINSRCSIREGAHRLFAYLETENPYTWSEALEKVNSCAVELIIDPESNGTWILLIDPGKDGYVIPLGTPRPGLLSALSQNPVESNPVRSETALEQALALSARPLYVTVEP